MCKKRPSEASKTCSEHSENSVFQANMPKIVKNVAFTNVVKSFWSQIIPTVNPAVLGTESIREGHQRAEDGPGWEPSWVPPD